MTQQEFMAIAKRFGGRMDSGAPPPIVNDDGRKAIWFGNLIIFIGLGLFFAWALFAPLDEGIPARGVVMVESMRKVVTHSVGGPIAAIYVRENQVVKAGDLMIRLESAKAQSSYDSVAQEYVAASSKLARLHAEQTLASEVEFPEDLLRFAEEIGRLDSLKAQLDLFHMRRTTLASELAILRETINASAGQVAGLRQQYAAKTEQYSLLTQEAASVRSLVETGYASRNSLLDLERRIAELTSSRSELQTRSAKEASLGTELRLRQLQRQQEFLRDVDQQITETRREVLVLQEKLNDVRIDLDMKKIFAPVDGQVVNLQTNTVGAAISPGAKILELVPGNETLLIDVRIPVQNIAPVRVGMNTDIRVSAFIMDPLLVIEGVLMSISTDIHEAQPPNEPYYLGRVAVTPKGMEKLAGRQLRPGMSVDVIIKIGERSLMAYLLRPLMKQLFYGMKEQ